MGSFYLILGLIFSLLIAIIALANTETVTVSYLFGRAELSLILLIFGSAFFGALIMGFFSLFRAIRNALAFRESRHKQEALQKQVRQLEEELLFVRAELSSYSSIQDETETDLDHAGKNVEPNELEEPAYRAETTLEAEIDEDH